MKTIYSNRIELNNWEIIGIQAFLTENYEVNDFIYSDNTIHLDLEEKRFGIYKTGSEDLYITLFLDNEPNKNYRLNLGDNMFHQLDEEFNFITEVENIFNI